MALFTLLNEPYSSQVLKTNEIKSVLMFMCLNRCKETEDPVQSSRITAHPDSSPTPNRNSRGSLQEPTAMDNTLMLESRVAQVSNSCGLKSIYAIYNFTATDLNLLSCRCCFHYRHAELQEARWEDLHAEEQAVCGEPAHRNHRGGCGEALLQVWKTFWDLHQQGKRLWLHQAGEFDQASPWNEAESDCVYFNETDLKKFIHNQNCFFFFLVILLNYIFN